MKRGDNIKDLNIKQIIILLIIVCIVIGTIGLYIYKTTKDEDEYYDTDFFTEVNTVEEEEDDGENTILVHITGSVKSNGIVILKEGARIIDAIEAAGGETEDADVNKLNLAYELQDGEKLYIPSINDAENLEYITKESGDNVIVEGSGNMVSNKEEIININTANKDELTKLPGIGESTANKIITYREENGKFKDIEEIKNVPGIGNAKFESIKDSITV